MVRAVLMLAAAGVLTGRVADWLVEARWFAALGAVSDGDYLSVYWRILKWRGALFGIGAAAFAISVGLTARRAIAEVKISPAPLDLSDAPLTRRRLIPLEDKLQFDRFRPWILAIILLAGSLLSGTFASQQWMHAARFFLATPIGQSDPYLSRDLSFYLFRLPFLFFGWTFVDLLGWMCLLLASAIYAYEDVWEVGGRRSRLAPNAARHLAAIAAFLLIWKIPAYRLAVWNALVTEHGPHFGVTWADVHWRWPLGWLCSALAVAAAIGCLRSARRGQIRLAVIFPVGFAAISVALNGVLPAVVQRWFVESSWEKPYQTEHRRWTLRAHALDKALSDSKVLWKSPGESQQPNAADWLPSWPIEALRREWNEENAGAARWSRPQMDRYRIGNSVRPVYVATVATMPRPNSSWPAQHSAAPLALRIADAARLDGAEKPRLYFDSNNAASKYFEAPFSKPPLRQQPPMNFGVFESATHNFYVEEAPMARGEPARNALPPSIFDASRGRRGWTSGAVASVEPPYALLDEELLDENSTQNKREQHGGVALGNGWSRLALAWHQRDRNLLLSSALSAQHGLAWHRSVAERCSQLAPWLLWSGSEPLPVLQRDGRLVWLLDGFSIATSYPLARPLDGTNINRVQAAVVAAVDAVNGATQLYIVDPNDPQTRLFGRLFPDLLRPLAQMPDELRQHLRYPPRLAAARAEVWARYGTNESSNAARPLALHRDTFDGLPAFLATTPALPATLIASPNGSTLHAVSLLLRNGSATDLKAPTEIASVLMATRDTSGYDSLLVRQLSSPLALSALQVPPRRIDATEALRRPSPISSLALLPLGDCLLSRDVAVEADEPRQVASRRQRLVTTCDTSASARAIKTRATASSQRQTSSQPTPTMPRKPSFQKPSNQRTSAISPRGSNRDSAAQLRQAKTWWQKMQSARKRGDWKAYQNASRSLDKVLSAQP